MSHNSKFSDTTQINKKKDFYLTVTCMALNSNSKVLYDVQSNYDNVMKMYGLFSNPVVRPTAYSKDIPWKQMKIETAETFSYKENRSIRFVLPRSGLIDPRSIRLSFNCRAMPDTGNITNTTNPHLGCFVFDINSIFSKVSLLAGRSQVISEQNGYNYITRTISKLATESQMNNMSQRANYMGTGSTEQYQASVPYGRLGYHGILGSSTTRFINMENARRYLTPVQLGMFVQRRPIVLDPFSEQLELEIILDKGDVAIHNTLGATTTIKKYYVELGYPTLHFTYFPLNNTPLYKVVEHQLNNNGFSYQYSQWDYNTFTLQSNAQKQIIDIPIYKKWIKYAVAFITCEADKDNQTFSSFRTYATLDPTSTYSNGFNATAPALEERRNLKRSTIKQYQWIYNKQHRIPEKPCQVCTAPDFVAIDTTTGLEVEPMLNNNNVIVPRDVTAVQQASNGEEAWYHVEQLFLQDKDMFMQLGLSGSEQFFVPYFSSTPYYGALCNGDEREPAKVTGSGGVPGRVCSHFLMVGQFSQPLYDGTMSCLAGGTDNETLQLEIETNGVTSNANPPKMVLHTFVAYDSIMVAKYGQTLIEQ